MTGYELCYDEQGKPFIRISLTGYPLINHPLLNKGTAFNAEERATFQLTGLLPHSITNLALQKRRSYETLQRKTTPLEKYIYLRDLQDSNETVLYSLLLDHIEELMPIVYTPTVGVGCQWYSHIYRRPRGLFLAYPDRAHIDQILTNPRFDATKIIVVSDGERILGLGDQGAGGMGIPIGKLQLYTLCAGIYPAYTLPILLDTGTNNSDLLKDPLYIGWHHERIRGDAYDEFVDLFVQAIKKRFPHVLLHWEDFAQANANPLLARYRDSLCTFNDDIQGTAAVACGALLSAVQAKKERLTEQRIVIFGAGSAGCGIANLLVQAMRHRGLSEAEAHSKLFLLDRDGLLREGLSSLLAFQKPFAKNAADLAQFPSLAAGQMSLKDVVMAVKPTILLGTSSQSGAFTEEIIRFMAKNIARPIIFPLSNPNQYSEAHPRDLVQWTDGRAIISTGSPFEPVEFQGQQRRIDQTNNCYIFPGIGLGVIAVQARRISDHMFMAAAEALAACSPAKDNPKANILPPLATIRDVSYKIALAVAKAAIADGLADPIPEDALAPLIQRQMWAAEYLEYRVF